MDNPWLNKAKTGEFFVNNYFCIWKTDKEKSWKHVFMAFGIRRSRVIQLFPIRLISDNSQKSILFGFWKLYFEIGYKY
jgi:hypothetical protein